MGSDDDNGSDDYINDDDDDENVNENDDDNKFDNLQQSKIQNALYYGFWSPRSIGF